MGTPKKTVFLPDLFDVPSFMDSQLITIDGKTGLTVFNFDVTCALIASMTLTIKDVYTFSSSLTLCVDSANLGEQLLQMVDNRLSIARSIYLAAIKKFHMEDLLNFYIRKHRIPIALLATVLLQVFKNRESSWKECKEGLKAETLSSKDKEQTPVFIVDALKFGAFLNMPKRTIIANEKTFPKPHLYKSVAREIK